MPDMNSSALDGAFCVLVSTIATWVRYDGIAGEVQLIMVDTAGRSAPRERNSYS
jgi:hypothetical protein